MADQDGQVIEKTDDSIKVLYKDGTETTYSLGKDYGQSAGKTYPYTLVSDHKVKQRFKAGEVLVYNSTFFTPDPLDPGQVLMKNSVMARTALVDNIDTLEDGSIISEGIAKKLDTSVTEVKTIEVRFDQYIHNLVKEGEEVDIETILCTIEDPETAEHQGLSEEVSEALLRLSSMNPRAKVSGVVSRIEAYYRGDTDELSPPLRKLIRQSDAAMKARAEAAGKPPSTGQVADESFRIQGRALPVDTVGIRFYIDKTAGVAPGDKGVFANQMKTVFSNVMSGQNLTEDGSPIDAIFGNVSVEDRIVMSVKLIGTTNHLLKALSTHVGQVYRGTSNARRKL